ncbi:MAG: prepilin-type N-terminal cleavage/methylation domain-containing protein [Nitrosomonadales bacterium]|nr:prepilin-type N-terminal cleavage/methylation domain-containing protein [Nitrosomonadales bacterium]
MKTGRGFTLIELIIVIIIVVVLAGLFLMRVPFYQEQAEKTAMQQVSGAIQSALVLRYGALVARGADNRKELDSLMIDNPVNWLQQKPQNYAGEFYAPSPGAVAPGNWLFDLQSREMVYVLNRSEYFTSGKDGSKWIRFRVRLGYEPKVGRPAEKELVSVLFEPAEPYRWFE